MQVTRSSTDGATTKGSAEWFTGDVYIDTAATASAPSRGTSMSATTSTTPPAPSRARSR